MIPKDEFLEKYRISIDDFEKTKLDWDDLVDIYNDYDSRRDEFEPTAKDIVERLLQVEKVHSVRYRIKNSEHLIEKIIRKKIADKKRTYTLENYISKIDDIIGVRALHLFKNDWEEIDQFVQETWKTKGKPTGNIRNGDSEELIQKFQLKKFNIKVHKYGYRSIHYILESSPTKKSYKTELQVRTIFEEAWSEIDHTIRYPYDQENPILKQYLLIFNRIAGNADEMGTYIKFLQKKLEEKETIYSKKLADLEALIEELRTKIENLDINNETKKDIEVSIDTLRTSANFDSWAKLDTIAEAFSDLGSMYPTNPLYENYLKANEAAKLIFDSIQLIEAEAIEAIEVNEVTVGTDATDSVLICSNCNNQYYNDRITAHSMCKECRDK